MKFFRDFRSFLFKQDIITLATAVIIAAALKSVINSIVDDVIMPFAGFLLGGIDFSKQFISLDGVSYGTLEAAKEAEAAVITYGNLIQAFLNFIIIGFVVFLMLRAYERSKKKKEAEPVIPPKEEVLLTEIRDELRKNNQ